MKTLPSQPYLTFCMMSPCPAMSVVIWNQNDIFFVENNMRLFLCALIMILNKTLLNASFLFISVFDVYQQMCICSHKMHV